MNGPQGQKWSEEQNKQLLKSIGEKEKRYVKMGQFVLCYKDILSSATDKTFMNQITQFLECGKIFRKAKMTERLERLMASQQHGLGLLTLLRHSSIRLLRQVTWRFIKGEIGMRMDIWRLKVVDLHLNLDFDKHGAMRQLRTCLWRLVKGDLGVMLDAWRMNAMVALTEER